jgi:predicted phosphodiesterase
VFDLLHSFDRADRLQLIVGNHDLASGRQGAVDKGGLFAREGLILEHSRSGQEIFVAHGHQADLASDTLSRVCRLANRYIWRRLQQWGLAGVTSPRKPIWNHNFMERAIMSWAEARSQITICGHTHRPMAAVHDEAPYFNVGSCVFPGAITGLELRNGSISLVSWLSRSNGKTGAARHPERRVVAPPRLLHSLR